MSYDNIIFIKYNFDEAIGRFLNRVPFCYLQPQKIKQY